MRALLRQVVHTLEKGQDVELVTVLASGGSTPRGAGAVLAVFPDGSSSGTVGGGNGEYEAQKLASKLLETGENALREFRFIQGDAASLGMAALGMNAIHFGIMMIFNLCIGTITPPVGTTLFVGVKVGGVKIETVVKQLLIYFAAIFVVLLLVTYIPMISLWLPSLWMRS